VIVGNNRKVKGPIQAKLELCVGSYHAEQIGHTIILTATGAHPTTGYEVFLQQSPIDVFPPEFSLWHKTPSGIVLQVVTPYSESIHFISAVTIKQVVVHDANGRHTVSVEQAAAQIQNHLKKLRKDGPFPMEKKPTKTLLAMTIAASGSNDAWTNLKRVLTLWSKVDGPGIGDKLSWLWAQNSGGQSYPNLGIPNLIKCLQGDSFFGPCPATGTLEASQFLPTGKYDTVGDLLDELDSCGS
jgi:hypothetical protein